MARGEIMKGNHGWNHAVLEKTLESSLDRKDIKPVNQKGNQRWIFIGRTDAEAATPILWPPDMKSWLIGKDPDAGKDWGQEEKGTTEGEMVGWHHRLNGHEFEQTPGVSEGWGILACWSSWGLKESGHNLATEQKQEMESWKEKSVRWCLDLEWFSEQRHGWVTVEDSLEG